MKKDIINNALEELGNSTVPAAPTTGSTEVVTAADVEAYKRFFANKWEKYAKRGNPFGMKKGIGAEEEDYRRGTLIYYTKQYKALQRYAEEEGLTLKEAVEIAVEIGLKALGATPTEDIVLTAADVAPKFTRKK